VGERRKKWCELIYLRDGVKEEGSPKRCISQRSQVASFTSFTPVSLVSAHASFTLLSSKMNFFHRSFAGTPANFFHPPVLASPSSL
jgi:hypothetical protein